MSRALAECRRREGLQQHIHMRKLSLAEIKNDCGSPSKASCEATLEAQIRCKTSSRGPLNTLKAQKRCKVSSRATRKAMKLSDENQDVAEDL